MPGCTGYQAKSIPAECTMCYQPRLGTARPHLRLRATGTVLSPGRCCHTCTQTPAGDRREQGLQAGVGKGRLRASPGEAVVGDHIGAKPLEHVHCPRTLHLKITRSYTMPLGTVRQQCQAVKFQVSSLWSGSNLSSLCIQEPWASTVCSPHSIVTFSNPNLSLCSEDMTIVFT
jgi:hypothetical protein